MLDERRLGLLCGALVLVFACLTWFVPWYSTSSAPDEILYSDELMWVEQDFKLTKIITHFECTDPELSWSMETHYSTLGSMNNPDDYEELRTVIFAERAVVVAVAIIGGAIVALALFGKTRLLKPLGALAIVLSLAGLVYFALAASGTDAEFIGLSGTSVFETEGFWGSSSEETFGPAIGWFLLIAVVATLACMTAVLLRGRSTAGEGQTAAVSEEISDSSPK